MDTIFRSQMSIIKVQKFKSTHVDEYCLHTWKNTFVYKLLYLLKNTEKCLYRMLKVGNMDIHEAPYFILKMRFADRKSCANFTIPDLMIWEFLQHISHTRVLNSHRRYIFCASIDNFFYNLDILSSFEDNNVSTFS